MLAEGNEEEANEEEEEGEEKEDDEEELEADEEPPGKLLWSEEILKAIKKAGLGAAMRPIVPAIEGVFASAGTVSTFLIVHRMVNVDGTRVTLGSSRGEERLEAVRAFADEVMDAASKKGLVLDGQVVISVILQLLETVSPEPVAAASGVTTRSGNSPGAYRATAKAIVKESDSAALRRLQMPQKELNERVQEMAARDPNMAPKANEMPHLQQMKILTRAIEEDGDVPRAANVQPAKICDAGDLTKKAVKDEDIEACDTTNRLVMTERVVRWAYGVGAAAVRTKGGAEAFRGALAVAKAVQKAVNITTAPGIEATLEEAMNVAHAVRDGDFDAPKSIGAAFQAAAKFVVSANASIRVEGAMAKGVKRGGRDDDGGGGGGGGGGGRGGGGGGGGGGADGPKRKRLKLEDGARKWFEPKAGGNDDCPVECNSKKCKKKTVCVYSHVNK